MISAHRGALTLAPENTLKSYEYAFAYGVELVEVDVQQTRDGRFVALHDSTVDRTTNGTGNIADLTFEQARSLNAADYDPWRVVDRPRYRPGWVRWGADRELARRFGVLRRRRGRTCVDRADHTEHRLSGQHASTRPTGVPSIRSIAPGRDGLWLGRPGCLDGPEIPVQPARWLGRPLAAGISGAGQVCRVQPARGRSVYGAGAWGSRSDYRNLLGNPRRHLRRPGAAPYRARRNNKACAPETASSDFASEDV
ncbi:glycerophosphodiester phosphodiesterase family protein [Actinopolymorpha sp. B9G3]|uniref:glycerophosphodiester phosphodiesterase n=1 Tax=Actinopolymorpha sp. B9G3 TaxID=3158970 RepID=UPI0032D90CEB